jgi:hypothetical protein
MGLGEVIRIGLLLLGAWAVFGVVRRSYRNKVVSGMRTAELSPSQRRSQKIEWLQLMAAAAAGTAIPAAVFFHFVGLDTLVLAMAGVLLLGGAVFGVLEFVKALVD